MDTARDAYLRLREYLNYQELDLEQPIPTVPAQGVEYVLGLIAKHHRVCTKEVLQDAVLLDRWFEYQVWLYAVEPQLQLRLALWNACQHGKDRGDSPRRLRERERLSYAELGKLYGYTRQGIEQAHLRLREAFNGRVRDPARARQHSPKKRTPRRQ